MMEIAAYTFMADLYCSQCINVVVENDIRFDGWQLSPAQGLRPIMNTEANLEEIALAFGIDRQDETTFDSDEFPKVVFAYMLTEDDCCGECGENLLSVAPYATVTP